MSSWMNKGFNRLFESYLVETIESTRNQYSHIPDEDFDRIIRLDPTFNPDKDSVGDYGVWLLSKYKKDNPLNHEPQEVYSILSKYDTYKKDRAVKIEKDINKFKTLQDMENAVKSIDESPAEDNKDYEIVAQDEDWAIFKIYTHTGARKLGKSSGWCTAHSNPYHYNNYLQRGGNYYVIMNKHDKSDKYQIHFESGQCFASGRGGEEIELDGDDFLEEHPLAYNYFKSIGYDVDDFLYNVESPEIHMTDVGNFLFPDTDIPPRTGCWGCKFSWSELKYAVRESYYESDWEKIIPIIKSVLGESDIHDMRRVEKILTSEFDSYEWVKSLLSEYGIYIDNIEYKSLIRCIAYLFMVESIRLKMDDVLPKLTESISGYKNGFIVYVHADDLETEMHDIWDRQYDGEYIDLEYAVDLVVENAVHNTINLDIWYNDNAKDVALDCVLYRNEFEGLKLYKDPYKFYVPIFEFFCKEHTDDVVSIINEYAKEEIAHRR